MKPACWEACFLYPCPTVEHSNNCLLLLCVLFLKPSGHYTKIIYLDTPSVPVTASGGQSWFVDIPYPRQDGYIPIAATINGTNGNTQAYIMGIHQLTNGSVRVAYQNYSGGPQAINISAKVILVKQT